MKQGRILRMIASFLLILSLVFTSSSLSMALDVQPEATTVATEETWEADTSEEATTEKQTKENGNLAYEDNDVLIEVEGNAISSQLSLQVKPITAAGNASVYARANKVLSSNMKKKDREVLANVLYDISIVNAKGKEVEVGDYNIYITYKNDYIPANVKKSGKDSEVRIIQYVENSTGTIVNTSDLTDTSSVKDLEVNKNSEINYVEVKAESSVISVAWVAEAAEEDTEEKTEETTEEKKDENAEVQYVRITAESANLRKVPSVDGDLIATVEKGIVLELVSTIDAGDSTWYEVAYNGHETYVRSDLAEIVDNTTKELIYEGEDYTVTLTYGKDAQIPDGAEVKAEEIKQGKNFDNYCEEALDAMNAEDSETIVNSDKDEVGFAKFYDISIYYEGEKIEPAASIDVNITYDEAPKLGEDEIIKAVHFGEDADPEVLDTTLEEEQVTFRADSFSVYGVIVTNILTKNVLTANGDTYTITVTYGEDAKIPAGATLDVEEIPENSEEYLECLKKGNLELYGDEEADICYTYVTLFDITIRDKDGNEIEPSAEVDVNIAFAESQDIGQTSGLQVLHFAEDGTEQLEAEVSKDVDNVSFSQSSFSNVMLLAAPQAEGGSVSASAADEGMKPESSKTLTSNNDGTYTLSLSVTGKGKSETTSNKVDVIVVLDRSGSMNWAMSGQNGSGSSRMTYAKNAVNNLAETLLGQNEAGVSQADANVRLSLVSFAYTARQDSGWTTSLSSYQSAVNSLSASGATNWEDALTVAQTLMNSKRSDATPYVIFVSDGDPTLRNTKYHNLSGRHYDYWSNRWVPADEGYDYHSSSGRWGTGNSDPNGWNYTTALNVATSLVNNGAQLYSIGVSSDVTKITQFTNAAGGKETYTATNEQQLKNAFSSIIEHITNAMKLENVDIKDTLTSLTGTTVGSSMINGVPNSFTYKVTDASGNDVTSTISNLPPATYNETTKTVDWNLAGITVENGYTYEVSFIVYPTQEAYDIIAQLQNGTLKYDDLEDDIKSQIKKREVEGQPTQYALYSNTASGNGVTYEVIKTENDQVIGRDEGSSEFTQPDPMSLVDTQMAVEKVWDDSVAFDERPSSVTMYVMRQHYDENGNPVKDTDGNDIYDKVGEVVLSASNNWKGTYHISPGLIVKGNTLDHGYNYKFEEDEVHAKMYEFTSEIVRPMLRDSALELEDISGTDTHETALVGTNRNYSHLNIAKKLIDFDGNTVVDTESFFTFEVTVNDTLNKKVTFKIIDADGKIITDPDLASQIVGENDSSVVTITANKDDNGDFDGTFTVDSEKAFQASIKAGWEIEVLDLPTGTEYTVEEIGFAGYEFKYSEDGYWTYTDNTSGQSYTKNGEVVEHKNTTDPVTRKIEKGSRHDYVYYYNQQPALNINLKKVDALDTTKVLPGAEFNLYTDENLSNHASRIEGDTLVPVGTITVGSEGIVEIGKLNTGTYYLVETKAPNGYVVLSNPIVITVGPSGVTYKHPASIYETVVTDEETTAEQQDGVYTIIAKNDKLYSLPESGGSGIYIYMLGGILCMVGAAFIIIKSKEREVW